jgi:hypothetical protein
MIASAGVRHKAEEAKRLAFTNLALGRVARDWARRDRHGGAVDDAPSRSATPEAAGMQSAAGAATSTLPPCTSG